MRKYKVIKSGTMMDTVHQFSDGDIVKYIEDFMGISSVGLYARLSDGKIQALPEEVLQAISDSDSDSEEADQESPVYEWIPGQLMLVSSQAMPGRPDSIVHHLKPGTVVEIRDVLGYDNQNKITKLVVSPVELPQITQIVYAEHHLTDLR